MTVVAQWAKAPGKHCCVAGSIPAVTPRYCINKIKNALWSTKKQRKKNCHYPDSCCAVTKKFLKPASSHMNWFLKPAAGGISPLYSFQRSSEAVQIATTGFRKLFWRLSKSFEPIGIELEHTSGFQQKDRFKELPALSNKIKNIS